jgi:hypothetical protein
LRELDSREAASFLEISEATFCKRLSRARAALDSFTAEHCGVANPANRCRCAHQVNHAVARGRLDAAQLRFGRLAAKTSIEALQARSGKSTVRRALELYRAQPTLTVSEDFAQKLREMLDSATSLTVS